MGRDGRGPRWAAVVLAAVVWPTVAVAGISSPNSSVAVSRDGTRILVMVSPQPALDRQPTVTLPDGRAVDLHATFARSGVYDARSLRPVWQVGWYSLPDDVFCSDDLRFVARVNRQGFRSTWAVAFYADGRPTRSYACGDLLTGLRQWWALPYSTWDWHVRWYDRLSLNPAGDRLLLTTARRQTHLADWDIDMGLQESYAFDLATGDLLQGRATGRWVVWAYGGGLAAAVAASAWGVRSLWRRLGRRRHRLRGFSIVGPPTPG